MTKIKEVQAIKRCTKRLRTNLVSRVCELIVEFSGDITKVSNTLIEEGTPVAKSTIKGIKYKDSYIAISDSYFKKGDYVKHQKPKLNTYEVGCVCEALIKNNGSATAVLHELVERFPKLTYTRIEYIKFKTSWSDVSDKYFSNKFFGKRDELPKLTDESVHDICKALVEHNGSIKHVFQELAMKINGLSILRIYQIKSKQSWRRISDGYFELGQFPKGSKWTK